MKKRFIFDLDETIVDSQIMFHSYIESELLRIYHGIKISPIDLAVNYTGVATRTVFKELAPNCNLDWMVAKKWLNMHHLAQKDKVKCKPGMYELILDLHKNGNQMAIASSAPKAWIETCLSHSVPADKNFKQEKSLKEIFGENYFSGDKFKDGKPVPDLFIEADQSLYLDGKTFVIGDTRMDVLAALAADIPVLYLSRSDTKYDKNSRVERFVDSVELTDFIRKKLM